MVAAALAKDGQPEWSPANWSFSCMLNFTSALIDIQTSVQGGRFCDVLLHGLTDVGIACESKIVLTSRAFPVIQDVFPQPVLDKDTGVMMLVT